MRRLLVLLLAALVVVLAHACIDATRHSRLAGLAGHGGPVTLLAPARADRFGGWSARARMRGEVVLLRAGQAAAKSVPPSAVTTGEVVSGLFKVGPPDRFASALGARVTLRAVELRTTGRRRGGIPGAVDAVRRGAQASLAYDLPPAQAGLLRGMVLGDDSALPPGTRDDFRASGLSHLMAASGQNIVLLMALALAVARVLGIGFTARWLIVLGLIALYVPLAGGGPSIQRAGVMGAVGVVALVSGRPADRRHALGLAAAATLAFNPRAIADPGWQMSFAAVAALLVLARPWALRLTAAGVPGVAAEALAVTGAATLATAPLIAWHFGTASPVTLPANLCAAPAVAPVMWLGLVSGSAGQAVPALATLLDRLAAPLLGFLTAVAHAAARAPGAGLRCDPIVVTVLCASALGLIGVSRPRRIARALAALALCGLLGLVPGAVGSRLPIAAPHGFRVTFLDVGQGDATLLQDGTGHAVLVDAGPPDAPIVARLRRAGVRRLDALVITHAQADHEGGAAAVLSAIGTGMVLDGRDGVRSPDGDRFAAVARRRGVRLVRPVAGQVITAGRLQLSVLSPPAGPGAAVTGADPNERAVVLLATVGSARVLLTADAESDVLGALALTAVDVLKVSHHGSADPGLPALLRRLRPRIAVIEVGAHNRYGHPAPATVAALSRRATLLRTDRDGTVRIDLEGRRWLIHSRE